MKNKLKVKMAELGISNKELAALTGLTVVYISMIRNNKVNITMATLQKIADALQIEVKELL